MLPIKLLLLTCVACWPLAAAQMITFNNETFDHDITQSGTQLTVVDKAADPTLVQDGAKALKVVNTGNEAGWPHFRLVCKETQMSLHGLKPEKECLAFFYKSGVAFTLTATLSVYDKASDTIVPVLSGELVEAMRPDNKWRPAFVQMQWLPGKEGLHETEGRNWYLMIKATNHWNVNHSTYLDQIVWIPIPRKK